MRIRTKNIYLDDLDTVLLPFTKVLVSDQEGNTIHDGYWINCMMQHYKVYAMSNGSDDGDPTLVIHCKS